MNNKLTNFLQNSKLRSKLSFRYRKLSFRSLKKLDYKYYIGLRPKGPLGPVGIIVVAVLIVGGAIYILRAPKTTEASWWNDSWYYRQQFDVYNNEASPLTDFQVAISTSTLQLATLSTAGKTNSDFSDLRFTDASGNLLDYWFEDDTDTMYRVYVKFPNLPASATSTMFMYYGNTSASDDRANGDDLFEFFDDFDGTNLDTSKWDENAINTIEYSINDYFEFKDSTAGTWVYDGTDVGCQHQSVWNISDSFIVEWDSVMVHTVSGELAQVGMGVVESDDTVIYFVNHSDWSGGLSPKRGVTTDDGETSRIQESCSTNDNVKFSLIKDGTNYKAKFNEVLKSEVTFSNTATKLSLIAHRHTIIYPPVDYIRMDDIRVSKYTTNEPTITTTSGTSEEKGPGPIGYWSFDEGYGTTAYDGTSNSNDGTITGATWKNEEDCIAGKCLYFDGSDDYVSLSNYVWDGHDGSEITVSGWFKLNNFDEQWFYRFGGNATDHAGIYLRINHDEGDLQAVIGNGSSRDVDIFGSVSNFLELNKWIYVVIAVDLDSIKKLYINGILVDSDAVSIGGTFDDNTGDMKISAASNTFNGFIDEVKIYPYARTEAQIKADYNAGLAGVSSKSGINVAMGGQSNKSLSDGLIAYWKMDESSWSGVADEVIDASGNANHGVAVNGASTTSTAKYAMAGEFDGDNDYVNCGSIDQSESFSVSTWINRQTIPTQSLESYLYVSNSLLRFSLDDDSDLESVLRWKSFDGNYTSYFLSDSNSLNKWIYLTIVYDGVNDILRGYKNGILQYTYNDVDIHEDFGGGVILGANLGNGWYFDGFIDEMRIYNRALSGREVKQLYEYAPGPVGYWDFEENEGTTLYDKSGNGNDGTLTNMDENTDWVLGKYGSALDFDGSDNYVDLGDISRTGTGDYSVSLWFNENIGETSHNGLISKGTYTTDGGFTIYLYNGDYITWYSDMQYLNTNSKLNGFSDGLWHYLTCVKKGNMHTIFVDGLEIVSSSLVGVDIDANNNVGIGVRDLPLSPGEYFNGKIDEVKIYNYARTPKQILEDMNGGRPAINSPIGYWKFDEGYGTVAYDAGLGENDGTINGASWTNNGKFGKALDFNGSSDYVDCGTLSTGTLNEEVTISQWIKIDTLKDYNGSFITGSIFPAGSDNKGLKIYFNISGEMNFVVADGLDRNIDFFDYVFNSDSWYYITVTAKIGDYKKLYVNGEYQEQVDISALVGDLNKDLTSTQIGVSSNPFDGKIDETKIFNYALTADEIRQEYNQGQAVVMGSEKNSSSTWDDGGFGGDPPVAYYNFEEGSGTTANDISGNGNTGTLNGMDDSDWVLGQPGWALDFDGTSDSLTVSDDSSLNFGTGSFSISTWVKPVNLGNSYPSIVHKYDGDGYMLALYQTTQRMSFYTYGSSNLNWTTTNDMFDFNQWNYITVTYESYTDNGSQSVVKFYRNGQFIESQTGGDAGNIDTTADLMISGLTGGFDEYAGEIDELKIYDYVRTPAQIAWDYNGGKPIGHWPLDDMQGTTTLDISGNGNNGTLTTMDPATDWLDGSDCKFEGCLDFDGSDDYIILEKEVDIENSSSINFWYYYPLGGISSVQYILSSETTSGFGFRYNGNNFLIFYGSSADNRTYDINLEEETWYMISLIRTSDTNINLYVDGKNVATLSHSDWSGDDALLGNIGRRYDDNYYINAFLDDVRIYNYALSEEQIKEIYNGGVMRFE